MKRVVLISFSLLVLSFPISALAGNTCETALPVLGAGTLSGPMSPGEVIWYEATGAATEPWVIHNHGNPSPEGFTIEVLNGECASPVVIATYPEPGDFQFNLPADGHYFIRITGQSAAFYYNFSVNELNDNCGDGTLLNIGDQADGAFNYLEYDNEWFQVSLNAGECIQFNVQPYDGLNYQACVIEIHDSPENCGGSGHSASGSPEGSVLYWNVPQDGIYYLRLYPNLGYPASLPGWYRLYVANCETVSKEQIDWSSLKMNYR